MDLSTTFSLYDDQFFRDMDDFVDYFLAESKRKDKVPAKSSKRHQCRRVRFQIPPAYLPDGACKCDVLFDCKDRD
ncbi:hypothetical protein LMH87_001498 [Akanthomyces muscarius]|uniref:Uncharacterized protein n=1 Tax=Akanthomyces muscarius TaxID=2231603 RepID=A0A9W8Q5T0_AKAMU|nr:hypothetical protein LMH87_001498 [Akanthomyces muscarius]KAJ4146944.1 hypothetical protein LMH87_001498 [Akanthomyces muscarius]